MHGSWSRVAGCALALCLTAGEARSAELTPPPGYQGAPALAGTGPLRAVWIDGRGGSDALFGAVLSSELPDTVAAPLAGGAVGEPALGANAAWGLAVWPSWTSGPSLLGIEFPQTGATRMLTAPEGDAVRPAVAVLGDVALVVWEDAREGAPRIYAARWVRNEGPREASEFPVTAAGHARWPRVAAGSAGFLVAWSEGAGNPGVVHARRFDASGCPIGPAIALSDPGRAAEYPDVAFAGDRWLVAWEETAFGVTRLEGRLLGEDGGTVGELQSTTAQGRPTWSRVAGTGAGFALAWLDLTPGGRGLVRAWVDTLGRVSPRAGVPVTAPSDFVADPAIAVTGDVLTLAWRLPRPDDVDDLLAARIDAGDTTSVPEPVLLTAVHASALGVTEAPRTPLYHASPNPFRDDVLVSGAESAATLVVVDASGRRVRTLAAIGPGRWRWDGSSESGSRAPAGVYVVRVEGSGRGLRLVRLP